MNYIKLRERKRANERIYFFLDVSWNGDRRQEATSLFYTLKDKNRREIQKKAEELRIKRFQELEQGYYGISKSDIDLLKYFEQHNKSKGYDKVNNPYEVFIQKIETFVRQSHLKLLLTD